CIAGTLPATDLFERALGAKTLFFSFSTGDEKLHAPNEFMRIRRLRQGLRARGQRLAAYAGLAASGLTVVFDNMMDGTACVTGNAPWRWDDIITDLGMRQADLAHAPGARCVRTVADIGEAYRAGRTGLVFGLEAATPIENELDRLDVLYGLGIRQIGIAYSDANPRGSGLNEPVDGGLTSFGKRAVRRMNQLGLAIDLSHSSDRTALDTCAASAAPG